MNAVARPWAALWSLIIGFFMILVDSTIVSVATPDIMKDLRTNTTGALWVTSAYLLAYAVPLLLAGRLGDRFGHKNVYLVGLTVFTLASLACGLSGDLTTLIIARTVQGLGAALVAPQTMAVIARIFPADRRGPAMAVWGTVGGIAAVVGPLVGGLLVSSVGWSWIFFINVPIGIVGFVLAMLLVPTLPTAARRFDVPGVALSAVGLFCVVFGVQEGARYDWGTITGIITVPAVITVGVLFLGLFIVWQARTKREPLLPLTLFRDRNFSLASVAMAAMGFAITCVAIPLMLYTQNVLGYSALQSALLLLPMALVMIGLARVVGRLIGRIAPRHLAAFGFASMLIALVWLGTTLTPQASGWDLVLPGALVGVGSAFVAAPLSTVAFRNLPLALAGAGSGAFNAVRQIGAVLGSAAIATVMQALLDAQFPHGMDGLTESVVYSGYATAMGRSLFLPATVLILGFFASWFFTNSTRAPSSRTTSKSVTAKLSSHSGSVE